jgi:hypothetical protein
MSGSVGRGTASRARYLAKRAGVRVLRAAGLERARPAWVATEYEPGPATAAPPADTGLFAIVVTWMEGDIIEATVRNAMAQGCERVLVVDNDSPDDTVARAVAAGAEVARSFTTRHLDNAVKVAVMNETVASVSAADGRDHIWWLWLDADELVHGPRGRTIRDLVTGLDRRFRIVGTRYFDHVPSGRPASVPGFHPLDLQPLCQEHLGIHCAAQHYKHHLQRWDRQGPGITSAAGCHVARARELLHEPPVTTFTHHFPYRDEATTRARAAALTTRLGPHDRWMRGRFGQPSAMSRRTETLDALYAGDFSAVNARWAGDGAAGLPRPWSDLVDPADAGFARWHTAADLAAAIADQREALVDRDVEPTGSRVRRPT